jgi:2-polyprenyl-6-methoxyphenol hydroxylase-like FAD-dependent oxidoreductase
MSSALIIGGGPAGSTASVLLAAAGWRVTLVEQHRFPRDKVCGECLSAVGASVLRRLGLFDEMLSRGAVRVTRTLLHAPAGITVSARLPRPMWGVSRSVLDGLLLDAARGAGARIVQPARCERLSAGPRPAVRVRDLLTNAVRDLDADFVLLADGKSALLGDRPPAATADLGIKAHFEHVDGPRDAIELFGLDRCYGGLAPIEGGRWNAALSVPAARVRRHAGDLACLFERLLRENSVLRRRLAGARQLNGWLASPLPRFAVRDDWPERVIPLGNAAAAIEPIGGEGMGLAMRSAELASKTLVSSGDLTSLKRAYRRLWQTRSRACRTGGALAASPRWSRPAARLLAAVPGPLRAGMALMGK